jgi:dolichol-phosphate mannosyltransferase
MIPSAKENQAASQRIAVVIPCYRVASSIGQVLAQIGPEVQRIYCVDDACPDDSGKRVQAQFPDPRVEVLFHPTNLGVGGATITGVKRALSEGADIIVKIDGDGQMDPRLIGRFLRPILAGRADFTKGNRFFRLESLKPMPWARLLGNAALSFLTKLSSGYWYVMDPTNGFFAIHRAACGELPLDKLSPRYFFESDLLFRLNTVGAVVEDVPMDANYTALSSNLSIRKAVVPFLFRNLANTAKRVFYSYFLRNFSLASLELLAGVVLLLFGLVFGSVRWWHSVTSGTPVTPGTVMLAALPTLLGVQMMLSFLGHDIRNTPQIPLQKRL